MIETSEHEEPARGECDRPFRHCIPDERQKGYAQLDANLDLSPNSSSWTISLFGRNLTDKRYLSFALPTIPATFGEMGTYSRGRQLGVRLSGRF